jgi:deoxyribodipyrimidine photo-lyase
MVVFTRDLRVHDNPVLRAAQRAGGAVIPLFVLDDAILRTSYLSPNKAAFLAAALTELDDELRRRRGRLVVRRGNVAAEVERLADELSVSGVHIAADVSGYSQRREHKLRQRLAEHRIGLHAHSGSITVCPPGAITPQSRPDHFAVFTPYYRKWIQTPMRQPIAAPSTLRVPDARSEPLPSAVDLCTGSASSELAVGGETTARHLLTRWLASHGDGYHANHNDLAADATSHLSPYLHFGCLSATEIVHRASRHSSEGRQAFIRQLAWRDFYHQLLADRPDAAHNDYRTGRYRWQHSTRLLNAWRAGRTGYPIVDAGMRQLARQGWMHNRARLITGSFLTKTLQLDWRLGAAHFMDLLVYGDVANNQLNWQWIAGTGTDTRPYRVLNPLRQAERFDADGNYVRRWVPELAAIAGRDVHTPWKFSKSSAPEYPPPIIDHDEVARRMRAFPGDS